MANWWEDAPLADKQAAPTSGGSPAGAQPPADPQASGNWWDAAPLAEKQAPPMSPFEQQMRDSPAAGMNPYAQSITPDKTMPLDPATRLPQDVTPAQIEGLRNQAEAGAQQDPYVMAKRSGIETGGADVALREAYMKIPPGQRDTYAKFMVNKYFDKRSGGNGDEVQVQYDKALGTHIFKDPADGKWKPLNDLGMDMEDAKDFMKYVVAPAGASAVAGAGAGLLTGSPFLVGLAATAADAATAGTMRANDAQSLIDAGLLPPSVSPGLEGSKEAAWAVGGTAVGGAVGKYGRRALTGVDDIPMAVDISRSTVDDMLKRFDAKYGDTMPGLTLDEKMGLVAKTPSEKAAALRVRSRKEALQANSSTRRRMLERQMENEATFKSGLDNFLGAVGKQDNPEVFRASGISADELLNSSTRIIDNLEGSAKTKLKQYDQSLTTAYQNANKTLDDLLGDGTNSRQMPVSFADAIDQSNKAFKDEMGKRYTEIGAATGGQKIFDVAPLKDELKRIRSSLQADGKFNQLMEGMRGFEPQRVIKDGGQAPSPDDDLLEMFFGDSFRKQDSGLMVPDSIKRQRADKVQNYSYEDINNALQTVRRRVRRLPANTDPSVYATFNRVTKSLEDIRDAGLKSINPELASSQQALDATYRIGKDTLDRGLLKRIEGQLVPGVNGGDGMLLPSTFDKMFKGDSGARTVRELRVLTNEDVFSTGVGHPIASLGVEDSIRKGLLGKLKEQKQLVTGTGGQADVITPEVFTKFKNDYRDALDYALKPGQLDKIENMTSLKNALSAAEESHKAAKAQIEAFPWGSKSIADDPTKLFRSTWGPAAEDVTKLRRNAQLREALRSQGDPEGLLTDYRKLIANDMMRTVQGSNGYVDPSKLASYLDKHQEQLKLWYTSSGQSGTDMVNNLKTYSDIGQTIMESAGLSHADKDALMEGINSVARAYVGVFTKAGRVLTAVKQLGGGASLSKEADFVLNPEKFVKNQEFYQVLDSQNFRALQRAGGHAFMQILRGDKAEPRQQPEQQQAPLFGQ